MTSGGAQLAHMYQNDVLLTDIDSSPKLDKRDNHEYCDKMLSWGACRSKHIDEFPMLTVFPQ